MLSAVIPTKNEESSIAKVIKNISSIVDLIIVIVNGCSDHTFEKIIETSYKPTLIVYTKSSLGPDVPRSIGARIAYDSGSDYVLFIDGDMDGDFLPELYQLIKSAQKYDYDIALTDCYPGIKARNSLAELVMYFRWKLNEIIKLSDIIGYANPNHGPHIVSKKYLQTVSLKALSVPPVALALAAKLNLNIGIGSVIPHLTLQSNEKNTNNHAVMMSKTIIGDCIEAINIYKGNLPERAILGRNFIGYDAKRDRQTLNHFLDSKLPTSRYLFPKYLNMKKCTPVQFNLGAHYF